jgi:tRNA-uridine 2-sulfurtransferase
MKAIILFSGGLDSILAAAVVKGFGIDVTAVNFRTPFTGRSRGRGGSISPRGAAELAGIPFREVYLGDEYIKLVKNPSFGRGRNINPCIDCRIFFIRKAGEILHELGASFIATGEVMGQRPMSQNKNSLGAVAKRSGFADILLRPLSAKLLPETLPERMGWVKREKLFGLSGRGRAPQIELAEKLGIKYYPNPGGGCLLTDMGFSKKISDLIGHESLNLRNAELLKFGRHFRIGDRFKLIVGRDEEDNRMLENFAEEVDYIFNAQNCKGPIGLGVGQLSDFSLCESCGIMARYASSPEPRAVIKISGEREEIVRVKKLKDEKINRWRI